MKKSILILSLSLYVISLTQKCYCTETDCGDSFAILISGIIGMFYGGAALTWLANPLLFVSWFTLNRNSKMSLITSLLSVLLSSSFSLFRTVVNDESGQYRGIVAYKSGYFLWVASCSMMLIGNIILIIHKQLDTTTVRQ